MNKYMLCKNERCELHLRCKRFTLKDCRMWKYTGRNIGKDCNYFEPEEVAKQIKLNK